MGSKGVFPTGLSVAFVNPFVVRARDLRGENKEEFRGVLFPTQEICNEPSEHCQAQAPTASVIFGCFGTSQFFPPTILWCISLHRNLFKKKNPKNFLVKKVIQKPLFSPASCGGDKESRTSKPQTPGCLPN